MMPLSSPVSQTKATHLQFLYASQTGNAESIALALHQEAQYKGFHSQCLVLDDFVKVDWSNRGLLLIFVVSTTGDGDVPDNGCAFWRQLKRPKLLDHAVFKERCYTILGLGDTNYTHFCNTAKRLDARMQEMGANSFYPRGLADDGVGLELVVDPWSQGLWKVLDDVCSFNAETRAANADLLKGMSQLKLGSVKADKDKKSPSQEKVDEKKQEIATVNTLQSAYKIYPPALPSPSTMSLTNVTKVPVATLHCELVNIDPIDILPSRTLFDVLSSNDPPYSALNPGRAKVISVKCLTAADAVKHVFELKLDLTEIQSFSYQPGDAIHLIAPNEHELVMALLERLQLAPNQRLLFSQTVSLHWPNEVNAYDLFRYFVDLKTMAKKPMLRVLAESCSDANERNALYYLCSKQGSDAYRQWRDGFPNLLDILVALPSAQPNLSDLLSQLTPMMPRAYSIACSPIVHPNKITIAFSVVYQETKLRPLEGHCSTWLKNLSSGDVVPFVPRPTPEMGGFHLPVGSELPPIVMIGAGTGISPFLGFLEHLHALKQNTNTWLYHGFRSQEKDQIYAKEWQHFVEAGTLARYIPVPSRAAETDPKQPYVQHALMRDAEPIFALLQQGALLYVCGDAAGMARAVHATLQDILVKWGGHSALQAAELLIKWQSERRYLRDIWS